MLHTFTQFGSLYRLLHNEDRENLHKLYIARN